MFIPAIRSAALCVPGCLAVCGTAAAETLHAWEVSAGYTAMRDTNDHLTFKAGWSIATAVSINRWLALAVDLDRQTASVPTFDGGSFSFASRAALGGLRASGRIGVLKEFVQVLTGPVVAKGAVFGVTDTSHHTALQPGLGVDVALGRRWSARGQIDARFLDSGREARLGAGLVYRIR